MKAILREGAVLVAVFLISIQVGAQEKEKTTGAQQPDMEAMMKVWMEAATPGEHHTKLNPFVGSWETTTSTWMGGPDAPATVTKGKAQFRWILEGRFLQQDYTGEIMGMPMTGLGFTGYDKMNKKYTSFWIDNFSTAMSMSEGVFDKSGTVLTVYGKMDEPLTGEHDKNVKFVSRWIDKDKFIFEIHDLAIGEPDTKVVEVAYTRKK